MFKTITIVIMSCVCLCFGVSEIQTKLQLISLISVFFNLLVKVLMWYECQFDEIFIVNTEQLAIHECPDRISLLGNSLSNTICKHIRLKKNCHVTHDM